MASRIDFGQPATVELPYGGSYGRSFTLLAYGFSVFNGYPMGATQWSGSVQGSGGDILAPRNQQPTWRIEYLQSNDIKGGCQR
ncbi:hypothetical protein KW790_01470 [Candidatus Parcubacteria bacterium]|nr:hypothetical protein [Candidatus Parcubacteria bacterium]